MADIVVGRGENTGLTLVEKSTRPRSVQQAPPYISRAPFYIQNPTLFTMDQWRLVAKEPVCRLCIRFIIREISALELEIYSDHPDKDEGTITYFKQLLTDADDGEGWHAFLSRVLQDAMELPIGGVVEIAPDDLTQMAGGLYHVDGATVYPTYDRNIPFVQINPYDTAQRVYFRRGQVERLLLMPRVDLRRRPFQEAPVESAFLSIEALSRMYIYYMKQLGDTPMAGILDLMDMTETEAGDWAIQFREMYEGIDPLKIPILYDHIKPAKFIPLARNPQDMALLENFRRFAELVASAFGLSIGDLRLFEHDRVLAGVEASQRVTARSGIGFYAQVIENFLKEKVLMSNRSGIHAKFKLGMTGESQAEAQLAATRSQILLQLSGNQPILKQIDAQKQAEQWKIFDIKTTGLPAAAGGAGPGGGSPMLSAGDNLDSMDQDTNDMGQMADENKSADQLAGESLSSMGQPDQQQGGQPYDPNDFSDYFGKSAVEKAEVGEKPGHPFRGNQYEQGRKNPESMEEELEKEEKLPPGKKNKALPGTLEKGTKVTLPNGKTGEAMGAACSTQSSADSRVAWWIKNLGQEVLAIPDAKKKIWNLVMAGTLPPPNVIAAVKKASLIKEGAQMKLSTGQMGIYAGAKRYTLAEAEKQANFMTQDLGQKHVVEQIGAVYLVFKVEGKAKFHEEQHGTKEDYYWPAEAKQHITNAKESTSFKTRPHPGDVVHHEGTLFLAEAKKTGNPIPAIFGEKKNAEKAAQVMAEAAGGASHGVFPINMTANGLVWLPAKKLATGTPTGIPAEKPVDVKKIWSQLTPKEQKLYTAEEAKEEISKIIGTSPEVGKPSTQPSTALTAPPAVKDQVTLTDGAIVEMVSFPSESSKAVGGVGTFYWNQAKAFSKSNDLTTSTGVQHLPFEAPAPPNDQNTKTAWYVGKVVAAGMNTPATPSQLPIPGQEVEFPTSTGYMAKKKGGSIKHTEAKPAVIPPPPPLAMAERPPVVPVVNNTTGFPKEFEDLSYVKAMGGETGTAMYKNAKGDRFIVKQGQSDEHVEGEALADELYRQMGVPIPDCKLYDTPEGTRLVERFVEGTLLKDMTGEARKKGFAAVQNSFAADALLANWDVVGTGPGHEYDNILIDKSGKAWRVDNGGALDFSGLGYPSKTKLSGTPEDLWTLRDPSINKVSANAFAGMSWKQIADQMQDISSRRDAILAAVKGTAYEKRITDRVDMFKHVAELAEPMMHDGYNEQYVEGVCHADVKLKASGIVDRLPGRLQPPNGPNEFGNYTTFHWVDENNKEWDDLRGPGKGNIMEQFEGFVKANGGKYQLLESWFNSQASSTWSSIASAMQVYVFNQTGAKASEFHWGSTQKDAQAEYDELVGKYGQATIDKSVQAYHAFVYNILSRVDMPNKDDATHTVRLYRVEQGHVLPKYGIDTDAGQVDNAIYRRSPLSSTAIASPSWGGKDLTIQNVPWHDVFGVYFHSRSGSSAHCAFWGDGENEFLTALHNNPASCMHKSGY